MRGSASAARGAVQAQASRAPWRSDPGIRKRMSTTLDWTDRNFASTSSSFQSSQAESSQAAARRAPGIRTEDGIDREEEFQKRLRDIQAFRRRKVAARESSLSRLECRKSLLMGLADIKVPFIPPGVNSTATSATPLKAALSTLLASGAALGGSPRTTTKAYKSFIYGYRSGLAIIDLEKTLPLLRHAASLVRDVVKADGVVLMVGSRTGMERCMDRAKKRLSDNGFVTLKWSPGLLTNAQSL